MKTLEQEYLDLMYQKWSVYDKILGLKDAQRRIQKRIDRVYGKKGISKLNAIIPLKNKKVLDVGSGCGEFVFEAAHAGAIGYGIEPDVQCIHISELLFRTHHQVAEFVEASAEHIPYAANFFDVVISNSVIEHVQDPSHALKEMVRVLKPEGLLRLKCPNFLYPKERHYKRFYIPFLPKWIEQLYFNIRSGRWTKFFFSLNRVTPYFVMKFIRKNSLSYKNLSLENIEKSGSWLQKILARVHIYPQIEFLIWK